MRWVLVTALDRAISQQAVSFKASYEDCLGRASWAEAWGLPATHNACDEVIVVCKSVLDSNVQHLPHNRAPLPWPD